MGHIKPRNHQADLGKLPQEKTNGVVMNEKGSITTAIAISKRANANLGIKISRHAISRRLNEINLNSRVASTKPYISKSNKMSRKKFATAHVIWTEGQWDCIYFSDESKFNLFGCDGGRFVRHSP